MSQRSNCKIFELKIYQVFKFLFKSGSFIFNDEEYFLEPIEEFDSKSYDLYEFSFVDFDKISKFSEIHILFKKKSTEATNQKTNEFSATKGILFFLFKDN